MTIETLTSRLARKFRGSSLDDIQGIGDFSIFGEAASNLLSEIDPYETVRLHRFNQFGGVFVYDPPSDLKGKKLIDPRPQDGRAGEDFNQSFIKEFDRDKTFDFEKVSVEFEDGNKVLKLSQSGKGEASVDDVSDDDDWSAAGGATGLEVDSVIQLDGSDTLRFDLGATGGYIENSTLTEVDLSDHESLSSFFREIYLPTGATSVTSISLRIGSSSTNYWTLTGTPQFGSYRAGVNLVRFDWYGASSSGTPDSSAIDYERLIFVTTASISDVRVGPLSSKLPTPYEVPYYSNCLFQNPDDGTFLDTPNDVDDEIILEVEAQNIFFYECCVLIAEDLSLDSEAIKFRKKLGRDEGGNLTGAGLYGNYKRDKPSEGLRTHTKYINFRRNGAGTTRLRRR